MFSGFICVVVCVNTSCSFISEEYSVIWIYYILLIHLSVNGHFALSEFLILAILVNVK